GAVAILGEFVSLHHLLPRDHDVVLARADVLLLHPAAAFRVQQVEGDCGRGLRRRKKLHRDGYQPEGNGPRSEWSHGRRMITWPRECPTSCMNTGASARPIRSEERRVGKEGRERREAAEGKKKQQKRRR